MSIVKQLVLSIVQFLAEQKQNEDISPDANESLGVAMQCLEFAFELSPEDAMALSVSKSLLDVFQEFVADEIVDLSAEPNVDDEDSNDAKMEAEKLKNEGNNLMKAEQFVDALRCYSKAIELDGQNAFYYCNRAAAHSKLNQHDLAIEDCKKAIMIDDKYSKAYGRMGLAHAQLKQHSEAVDCYRKAVALEPDNESYQSELTIVEDKLKSGASGCSSGMAMPRPNFGAMLNNPALMNMAQQMLQNRTIQQLMNQITLDTSQGAGGFDALAQVGQHLAAELQSTNPELVGQLFTQIGGGGGGANNPFNPPESNN